MTKRGPTDSDRHNGEGEVEVVTAAGERKTTSLKRLLDGARDLVSMTDEPSDEQSDPAWPAQIGADDQTIVTGNSDVAVPEQPPQATLAAYRRQHGINTQRLADETARRTSQLVDMDQRARARVFDIQHLFALDALRNEAAGQLYGDGWGLVLPKLIDEFAAEIDGWKADRGIS